MKEKVTATIDTSLVADMTVREVERMDYAVRKAGGSARAGVEQNVAIAAMFVWKQIRKYRFTEEGTHMKISRLMEIAQDARIRFIQQHIINYAAYKKMADVNYYLEDKGIKKHAAVGFWQKAHRSFEDYRRIHKTSMERDTWLLFQDHMRLCSDIISPQAELLEVAIRDYLIARRSMMVAAGQKDDIALLQKAAVCLIFLTAMQHSYKDFFSDIIKTHGVDFTAEFDYADLSKMARNMVWLFEKLGVKFRSDKDGDTGFVGVDINDSVRVNSVWSGIVDTLGDSHLLDETAMKAIDLNPESKKEYEAQLAEVEKQRLEEGVEILKNKFNKKAV